MFRRTRLIKLDRENFMSSNNVPVRVHESHSFQLGEHTKYVNIFLWSVYFSSSSASSATSSNSSSSSNNTASAASNGNNNPTNLNGNLSLGFGNNRQMKNLLVGYVSCFKEFKKFAKNNRKHK